MAPYGDAVLPADHPNWDAVDAQSRRVDVLPAYRLPWRCWHELAGHRRHMVEIYGGGMGAIRGVSRPQPLPTLDVLAWCDAQDLDADERDFVVLMVKAMDRVFLDLRGRQIRAELDQIFRK
ncbi:hypothetical protein [Acetobacter sacchari]|uniref:hypothetical protein n=1 Tax=Acetobacter sacchari TaxID=2661687 RepID=UPI001FAF5824|nr:hypothetical protein [Acetobacter sacchari]